MDYGIHTMNLRSFGWIGQQHPSLEFIDYKPILAARQNNHLKEQEK